MYDILIIGSGPAGLAAAVYAKRANLKLAVIEKEYGGTGQIAESERVDNYLGIPGINGFDLGEKFRNHAQDLGVEFIEQEVLALAQEADKSWSLSLEDGSGLQTKALIYAAGASPRTLGAKGEKEFLGKGVSFCAVCDGAFYKDQEVAVIGGGDTAVDDALFLSSIAKQVYLIHRREEFRAAASSVELLKKKDNVEFVLNETLSEITGDKGVESITLSSGRVIPVSGVFEAVGSVPASGLVADFVELDGNGYIVADEKGITKGQGLFVAGDVRTKQLRQVVTAVADGANAVTSAEAFLKTIDL